MKYFLVFTFLIFSYLSYSQQVISSAGKTSEAGGVILSWTIGEGVIATLGTDDTEITQGFHQPLIQLFHPVWV